MFRCVAGPWGLSSKVTCYDASECALYVFVILALHKASVVSNRTSTTLSLLNSTRRPLLLSC